MQEQEAAEGGPVSIASRPDRSAAFEETLAELEKNQEAKPEDIEEEKDAKDDAKDEAKAEPEKPEKKAEDPQFAKRVAALKEQERRGKAAVQRERQALERERAEWAKDVEAAKTFRDLGTRAKTNPVAALMALGAKEEDFEYIARQFFNHSQAAAKDPKLREAAESARKAREHESALEQTRRELEELRAERNRERQQAAEEQKIGAFLDEVTQSVDDESTPLVKTMVSKSASRARERMREVAEYLVASTGEVPTAKEVAQALERVRRKELEDDGIDPEVLLKQAKDRPQSAGEKRAARTLGSDLSTPTQSRSTPKTEEERRAETLRLLEEGRLE